MQPTKGTVALLIVTSVILSAMVFPGDPREGADATVVDTFKDGSSESLLTFSGAGTDTSLSLDLEANQTLETARFNITGLPADNGEYPANLTVFVGGDDKPEWRFKGEGYGSMGHQEYFNDSEPERYVGFQDPGSVEDAFVRLPEGADVTEATVELNPSSGYMGKFDMNDLSTATQTKSYSRFTARCVGADGKFYVRQLLSSSTIYVYSSLASFMGGGSSINSFVISGLSSGHNYCQMFYLNNHLYFSGSSALKYNLATSQTVSTTLPGGTQSWGWGGGSQQGLTTDGVYIYCLTSTTLRIYDTSENLLRQVTLPLTQSTFTTCFAAGHYFYPVDYGGSSLQIMYKVDADTGAINSYSDILLQGYDYLTCASYDYFNNNLIVTNGNAGNSPDTTFVIAQAGNWVGSGGLDDPEFHVGPKDGTPEWSHSGTFETKEKTGDLSAAFNSYLASTPASGTDVYGNQYVDVPLNLTSASEGGLQFLNLSVKYDYTALVDVNPRGRLVDEMNKIINSSAGGGNVSIPITVQSDSSGRALVGDLRVEYDGPPVFKLMPSLSLDEDTVDGKALDLSLYCVDDRVAPDELTYKVHSNSLGDYVGASVADGHWLALDATLVPDWNYGNAGTGGTAHLRISAEDPGGNVGLSGIVMVDVMPVNDEPRVNLDIPDVQMEEGDVDSSVLLAAQPYFTDVEFDGLHYAAAVDPLDLYEGEEGNLTASINVLNSAVEIDAGGDFNTRDRDPVPVWIYADDDPQVNTEADGYTDDDPPLANWTHQEILVTVYNVNDAPVWGDLPVLTTDEDVPLEGAIFLDDYVTDVDSDPSDWEFEIRSNSNRKLKVELDETDNSLSLLPAPDAFGEGEVQLEVSDGEDDSRVELRVVVNPVNDIPTLKVLSHSDGQTVKGNVTISGTAEDREGELVSVEVAAGDGGPWLPVEGTTGWMYTLKTAEHPNGLTTLRFRAFDGTDHSANITMDLRIDNPVNSIPAVLVSSPQHNGTVEPGMVTVAGSASDSDGQIKRVQVRVGNDPRWHTAVPAPTGWASWSFQFNASSWAGGDVVISVRASDGQDRSPETTLTLHVGEDDGGGAGDGGDGSPPDISGDSKGLGALLWALILVPAVIAVLLLAIILMWVSRKRREEEEREEEEKRREEEEAQMRKAEAVAGSRLKIADTPAPSPAPQQVSALSMRPPGSGSAPAYGGAGAGVYEDPYGGAYGGAGGSYPPQQLPYYYQAPGGTGQQAPHEQSRLGYGAGGGDAMAGGPYGGPRTQLPPPPPPGAGGLQLLPATTQTADGSAPPPPPPPMVSAQPVTPPPGPGSTTEEPPHDAGSAPETPQRDEGPLSPQEQHTPSSWGAAPESPPTPPSSDPSVDDIFDLNPKPKTTVKCYRCGGDVPVTSDQRPLKIQCPNCGAQGEI